MYVIFALHCLVQSYLIMLVVGCFSLASKDYITDHQLSFILGRITLGAILIALFTLAHTILLLVAGLIGKWNREKRKEALRTFRQLTVIQIAVGLVATLIGLSCMIREVGDVLCPILVKIGGIFI